MGPALLLLSKKKTHEYAITRLVKRNHLIYSMAIPSSSKTTIDNLPPSVSERYAKNEIAIKESGFYQDIATTQSQMRPQVPVLAPIQESQLETLTGSLGKTSSLALYDAPSQDLAASVFTYSVFPKLEGKDTPIILDSLERLKTKETSHIIEPVQNAVKMLETLNNLSTAVFTNSKALYRG